MTKQMFMVFNDWNEALNFMDEVGGCWGMCKDMQGNEISGSYYVKYTPKPLKKEYTGVVQSAGFDARFLADRGQNICDAHLVSGDMYNDFVGKKVKIIIEVVEDKVNNV